jgi:predicted transcriptional regulator
LASGIGKGCPRLRSACCGPINVVAFCAMKTELTSDQKTKLLAQLQQKPQSAADLQHYCQLYFQPIDLTAVRPWLAELVAQRKVQERGGLYELTR